jgi:hypothetical protein
MVPLAILRMALVAIEVVIVRQISYRSEFQLLLLHF